MPGAGSGGRGENSRNEQRRQAEAVAPWPSRSEKLGCGPNTACDRRRAAAGGHCRLRARDQRAALCGCCAGRGERRVARRALLRRIRAGRYACATPGALPRQGRWMTNGRRAGGNSAKPGASGQREQGSSCPSIVCLGAAAASAARSARRHPRHGGRGDAHLELLSLTPTAVRCEGWLMGEGKAVGRVAVDGRLVMASISGRGRLVGLDGGGCEPGGGVDAGGGSAGWGCGAGWAGTDRALRRGVCCVVVGGG